MIRNFVTLSLCSVPLALMASRVDTLRMEAEPIIPGDDKTIHHAIVWTPETVTDEPIPVLYLFHGFMGNQFSWENKAGVTILLDSLMECGAIQPLIVVMPYCIPQDTIQAVRIRSFTYNICHYGRLKRGEFERTFSSLDSCIRKRYNCLPDSQCAVAGLSYGGRVAANVARQRNYKVTGLFSPVLTSESLPLQQNKSLYWIRIGRHDIFEPLSRRYRRQLLKLHQPIDYMRTPGSHNWKNWRQYLIDFLKSNYSNQP